MKFKVAVEKESGYEIKDMRSDRRVEFTSSEFQDFSEANDFLTTLNYSKTSSVE